MISLTVTPDDGETSRYDREVKQLQTEVGVGSDYITGKLSYNKDYKMLSDPAKQEGYFISLKFDLNVTDTDGSDVSGDYEMYVGIVGHETKPVKVDDGYCVFRITDADLSRKLAVYAKKKTAPEKDYSSEKFYNLRELELLPKPQDT